jgi:hypothetical protein
MGEGRRALSGSDIIAICNIVATVIAVLASPLIALRISSKLEDRADLRKARMQVFKTLMSQRLQATSREVFEALNIIDVVFAGDRNVKAKWAALFEAVHSHELSEVGELRHDLLLAMAKSIGLPDISMKDVEREYLPQNIADAEQLYYTKLQLDLEDAQTEQARRAQKS